MIIVDGYNVIYKWKSLAKYVYNIELARARLIDILTNYKGYTGERVVVVFDSSIRDTAESDSMPHDIEVIYAPSNQGADIFIENIVSSYTGTEDVIVVTGDVLERTAVTKSGAITRAPERFEEEVKRICKGGRP